MDLSHLTPQEKVAYITSRIKDPCPDGQHVYEDLVKVLGKSTILDQICTVCFNFQGWIYNWEKQD
jgi:hypothetical protein